jgi:hypothetical protein
LIRLAEFKVQFPSANGAPIVQPTGTGQWEFLCVGDSSLYLIEFSDSLENKPVFDLFHF